MPYFIVFTLDISPLIPWIPTRVYILLAKTFYPLYGSTPLRTEFCRMTPTLPPTLTDQFATSSPAYPALPSVLSNRYLFLFYHLSLTAN